MNQELRKIFLGFPLAILSFSAVAERYDGRPHVLFIAIEYVPVPLLGHGDQMTTQHRQLECILIIWFLRMMPDECKHF